MRALGWGVGGEAWLWRRQLWAWEEGLVEECRALFSDVVLQDNVTDYWLWQHDSGGGYSVRGAYDLITSRGGQAEETTTDLIWSKQVPLKVSVVAWRLLRNKLPTNDNLVRCHIIPPGAHLCVAGCGATETAQHLFLSCPEALLPAVLFCSYCGYVAFRWCGMNEILEFLRKRNRHFIRCSTKLRLSPSSG
ncbi:hypothetical protein TSUD_398690 [Trifolium subterraneum]|uniref:Reverse transcriptase zinc-binding domain-containing protein n=1 Tax=Trifolium subterraneum TaxID=3900 RepID=A0A2Z6NL08_TRISU|nr:hypothetical protein TSUD_398690 [Trifolium subterraneum]